MPGPFLTVRFHAREKSAEELRELFTPPAHRGTPAVAPVFADDEEAARYYLDLVLNREAPLVVRGRSGADASKKVPTLEKIGEDQSPLTDRKLVKFYQTAAAVPIFGTHVVVALGPGRAFVAADAELADVGDIAPFPSISDREALTRLARWANVDSSRLPRASEERLVLYQDDSSGWHLAYFFKDLPVNPPEIAPPEGAPAPRGSLGAPLGEVFPRVNFLVDAHTGEVLFHYSANPTINVTSCRGRDELGVDREFYGMKAGGDFALVDGMRQIKTYDLEQKSAGTQPGSPVRRNRFDWKGTNRAAVSAHWNASRVHDFYQSVLKRNGIDGKGMELISVVHCTDPQGSGAIPWRNACWWNGKMWYGQANSRGKPKSLARFFELVAHELTHGVTEHTAGLIYHGQSGALDESISDLFGVIINNWYSVGPDSDPSSWDWEMGRGLGSKRGRPIRDLSNPGKTKHPDHMKQYLNTAADHGGVHFNCTIHTRAAVGVLMARDIAGNRAFTSREVAILYYLCLLRLPPLATFAKTLQTLVDVANDYFAGTPNDAARKVEYIRAAYREVGIA